MNLFAKFSTAATRLSGKPGTFALAIAAVLVWAASGPYYGFSDTWELVINTGTTIVTFLMVFLIQNTQNRDSAALQAKLDQLILTSAASNRFVGLEHLTDEEIEALRGRCVEEAKAEPEPFERQPLQPQWWRGTSFDPQRWRL